MTIKKQMAFYADKVIKENPETDYLTLRDFGIEKGQGWMTYGDKCIIDYLQKIGCEFKKNKNREVNDRPTHTTIIKIR